MKYKITRGTGRLDSQFLPSWNCKMRTKLYRKWGYIIGDFEASFFINTFTGISMEHAAWRNGENRYDTTFKRHLVRCLNRQGIEG